MSDDKLRRLGNGFFVPFPKYPKTYKYWPWPHGFVGFSTAHYAHQAHYAHESGGAS